MNLRSATRPDWKQIQHGRKQHSSHEERRARRALLVQPCKQSQDKTAYPDARSHTTHWNPHRRAKTRQQASSKTAQADLPRLGNLPKNVSVTARCIRFYTGVYRQNLVQPRDDLPLHDLAVLIPIFTVSKERTGTRLAPFLTTGI